MRAIKNKELQSVCDAITKRFEKVEAEVKTIESKLGMEGTEPECICWRGNHPFLRNPNCPIHGDKVNPDLSLKARVADLLGWDVPDDEEITIAWAMGALEEYCKNLPPKQRDFQIEWSKFGKACGYWVRIGKKPLLGAYFKPLPQAICEAICAHAEQSK